MTDLWLGLVGFCGSALGGVGAVWFGRWLSRRDPFTWRLHEKQTDAVIDINEKLAEVFARGPALIGRGDLERGREALTTWHAEFHALLVSRAMYLSNEFMAAAWKLASFVTPAPEEEATQEAVAKAFWEVTRLSRTITGMETLNKELEKVGLG